MALQSMKYRSSLPSARPTPHGDAANYTAHAPPILKAPIVTASWFTALPVGYIRIGISRGVPRGVSSGYKMYRKLAPGPWFKSVDASEYQRLYFEEVLRRLDPATVVRELSEIAGGAPAALSCFERAHDVCFCHRAFVSAWLHDTTLSVVPELGREGDGHGWRHPKMPWSTSIVPNAVEQGQNMKNEHDC